MPDRPTEPPFDPRYDPRPDPRPDPRVERYGSDRDSNRDPRFDPRDTRRDDPHFNSRDGRDDPRLGRTRPPEPPLPPRRNNRLMWLVGALALLLVAFFAYRLVRSGPGEDQLQDGNTATAAADDPEARCASQATLDQIKRELFRQAAATRGSDLATFDRLSSYAVLRVTSPVLRRNDEDSGTLVCGGDVALDLPPGVAVVGGRRTLNANLDYSLSTAADGSGEVITLSGAEGILVPLATLARTAIQPSAQTDPTGVPSTDPMPGAEVPDVAPPVPPPPPATRAPVAPAPPPPVAARPEVSARPSFDCARARTRGEIAICQNPRLAALDREMADFYNRAYRDSGGEVRAQLQRSRSNFLAYRDRCGSDRCIADTYRGRINEIGDIVEGRWRGR